MPISLVSSIGLALLLGTRHGMDADHLVAIDCLSRAQASAARVKLSRWSGVLFSAGHGAVVLAVALVLQAKPVDPPAWLEVFGSVLSSALLVMLGTMNLAQAWRGADRAAPAGVARLLLRLPMTRHASGSVLTGVLFALSFDTVTLAAWFGTTASLNGGVGALLFIAGAFVLGMVLCDGLNGLWVAHLIRRSDAFAARARRVFSGLLALIAFAVAGVGLLRLGLGAVDGWLDRQGVWVGMFVVALVAIGFVVARSWRPTGDQRRVSSGMGAS